MCTKLSTLAILRNARLTGETIAAVDRLQELEYDAPRARAACEPYKPGRYRAACRTRAGSSAWDVDRMSDYFLAVEDGLEGLRAVSTGHSTECGDCAEGCGYDASSEESMEEFARAVENGYAEESHFSWSGCQICGMHKGGDMHPWHAIDADGEVMHFSRACVDCVMFLANGEEPENWSR